MDLLTASPLERAAVGAGGGGGWAGRTLVLEREEVLGHQPLRLHPPVLRDAQYVRVYQLSPMWGPRDPILLSVL